MSTITSGRATAQPMSHTGLGRPEGQPAQRSRRIGVLASVRQRAAGHTLWRYGSWQPGQGCESTCLTPSCRVCKQ